MLRHIVASLVPIVILVFQSRPHLAAKERMERKERHNSWVEFAQVFLAFDQFTPIIFAYYSNYKSN
jgi:hypothetical protein